MATHPTRNPNDLTVNTVKFREICEAFDVLSQVELRAIYDKYGEYGLKEGVMVEGKRVGGGYFMRCQPEAIFDKVFNSINPWEDQSNLDGTDFRGSIFGDGYKGSNRAQADTPQDVVVCLQCTLEEFYVGSAKQLKYEIDEV